MDDKAKIKELEEENAKLEKENARLEEQLQATNG